jgi:hypothetical protein
MLHLDPDVEGPSQLPPSPIQTGHLIKKDNKNSK